MAPPAVGVAVAGTSWVVVMFAWEFGAAHLTRLCGLTRGDVGAIYVAAIGGVLLLGALALILLGALKGSVAGVVLVSLGIVCAVAAEWMLLSYLYDIKRFVVGDYGPPPLVDGAAYSAHSSVVLAGHLALLVVACAAVYWTPRWLSTRSA